jgi:hypothetical protein
MLFRALSAFFALTFAAGFLGWIKSQTEVNQKSTDSNGIFSTQSASTPSARKSRSERQHVAEAAR